MLNIVVNVLFSYFELFAAFICALSIFRLPIRYNLVKIAVVSLIFAIISLYTFANFPTFALLINFSCLVIMLTISYRLPFFYSLLIIVIYYFVTGIFEYGTFLFVSKVFHFKDTSLAPGGLGSRIAYLFTGTILLLVTWFIQSKKLGFMFIANKFTVRQSVKGYNFALSAILIASILLFQTTSVLLNQFSVHFYILVALTIIFLIGIYIAYKQNKKQLQEKYERLKNR